MSKSKNEPRNPAKAAKTGTGTKSADRANERPGTSGTPESDKIQQNLTPKQLLAVEALAAGATDSGAAQHSGLSRSHVNALRNTHPYFVAELARRRESVWASTLDSLRLVRLRAVNHIRDLIGNADADPELRLRAAMSVLELFPPPSEEVESAQSGETDADRVAERLAKEEHDRDDRRNDHEKLMETLSGGPDLSREIHRVWLRAERLDFACGAGPETGDGEREEAEADEE